MYFPKFIFHQMIERKIIEMKALKIDKKYFELLVAFFMTLALDTTMTFTMTSINVGWNTGFVPSFLIGWIIGFIVALPTSILVIPLARNLASRLISE